MQTNAAISIIEETTIAALRELFDDDQEAQQFVNELIGIFLTSGEETVELLRGTVTASDLPAASRHAHKLKGLSQNIGAARVAALCVKLEMLAKAEAASLVAATALCDSVEQEFKTSCDELTTRYLAAC